jgi:transglutaminase-like putative cysteine protease
MLIRVGFEIDISCDLAVPMLLALSVHSDFKGRFIGEDKVRNAAAPQLREYVDRFGNRITRAMAPAGRSTFWSDCIVEVDGRKDEVHPEAFQHTVQDLPDATLTDLLASRYCESDLIVEFAWKQFGNTPTGWARVQAICDFVHHHIKFGYEFGRPDKTAKDVLKEKTGVCRDFAHLAIALCRAMNFPARYCSGYLGDIGVPDAGFDDFCAWFEVFLGGKWHTFDARYNTPRIGRIHMVRGHDASDVAMITSFGLYRLESFRVWSHELDPSQSESTLQGLLQQRPHPQQRGLGAQLTASSTLTTALGATQL